MKLKSILRAMRNRLGVTQETLASRLGQKGYWIGNREQGRTDPTVQEVLEWAEECGFSVHLAFQGRGQVMIADLGMGEEADPGLVELIALWPSLGAPEKRMLSGMAAMAVSDRTAGSRSS